MKDRDPSMARSHINELERSILSLVEDLRAAAGQAREAAVLAHDAARQLSAAAQHRTEEAASAAE